MNKIKLFAIVFFFSLSSAFAQHKLYTKYKVEEGETVRSVCKKLSITPYRLLQLNPEIKDNENLDGVTILIVPNTEYTSASQSSDHVDYIKEGFLYHKVQPKETYSKLKREYGVKKKELMHYNSQLRFDGLKMGDVIKIPVKAGFKLPADVKNLSETVADNKTKPYIVKPKETKWRISRRYGITIPELEKLNPTIVLDGMKAGEIIMVPNRDEIPDESDEYVKYKVAKSEGLFRIAKNFDVTQEELLALNPELKEGVKEGMVIKIPLTTVATIASKQFVPSIKAGRELNVVFLLPFMSKSASVDFETTGVDLTADIATDYYLGASLALDSLKQQGLSVKVKTFDTENKNEVITSIFSSLDLSNVDVIIGPMFYEHIDRVSLLTRGRNIPIISPVSKKDHAVLKGTTIVQEMALEEALSAKVLSYIKDNYKGENLVVIGDDKEASKPKINAIVAKLEALDSLQKVTLIKPEKGYIKRSLFIQKILSNKDNIVVLATNDAVVTQDVINNLGSLPKNLKTTLFALQKGDNFDESKDIYNQLAHVNFHYPEYNFVDEALQEVQNFISKYKKINFAVPSAYAFLGFDTTYDTLLRLASFENMNDALNAGSSERMSTKFQYKKGADGKGYVNNAVYLIKYDGLNLVKVE